MNENPDVYPLTDGSTILIRTAGDLCLRGWDQPGLEVLCDGERVVNADPAQNLVRVVAKGDLYISVPAAAEVRVEHASGDALVYGIAARLDVQKVSGNLILDACAQVDLGMVGGDLRVRRIGGPLNIQRVAGDFNGEAVGGGVAVESVGGDAVVELLSGGVRLRSGGDLKLGLPKDGAEEVVVKAGGDVQIHICAGAGLRLDLASGGHEIEIDVDGHVSRIEQSTYLSAIGDGVRPVRARSGGSLFVHDEAWDEQGEGDSIEAEIEAWEERKSGLDNQSADWSGFEQRIRSRTEEAARRAEDRVREAMGRVERQNRHRGDLFKRFGWNFNFGFPPVPPMPPAPPAPFSKPAAPAPFAQPEPLARAQAPAASAAPVQPEAPTLSNVSNDERLLVLKMLQEHKISVEEAEQLLSSLEGNFD